MCFHSTMSRDGHAPNKKNVCFHTTMSKAWALSKQKINVCFHYAMPRGGHAPNKKSRFASTMQCPVVGSWHAPNQKVCLLPIPIRSKKASLFLRFLLFYFFIISIFTLLYVQKHNFYSFSLFICSFGCVYKCSNFVTILYPLSS